MGDVAFSGVLFFQNIHYGGYSWPSGSTAIDLYCTFDTGSIASLRPGLVGIQPFVSATSSYWSYFALEPHPLCLQVTTMLGWVHNQEFFALCRETDHSAPQCAMSQLQQPTLRSGNFTAPRMGTVWRICLSWNKGNCTYPGTCTYRHVCSWCFQPSNPTRDCLTLIKPWASSGTHQPPASSARSFSL